MKIKRQRRSYLMPDSDIDFVAFLKRRLSDEFLSPVERAYYKRMLIKEQENCSKKG